MTKIYIPNEKSIITKLHRNRVRAGLFVNVILAVLVVGLFVISRLVNDEIKDANSNYVAEKVFDGTYIASKEFDSDNDVDDRISLSQDFALKAVTKMFSHTSSTFTRNIEKQKRYFTDSGYKDLLANLKYIHMAKDVEIKEKIVITSCSFSKGIPLVLDFILNDSPDSTLDSDVYTLQINIIYLASVASGSPVFRKRLKFTLDVHYNPYSQEMLVGRMSRWEESF